MKKLLLVNLLSLFVGLAYAGNLSYGWYQNSNKDIQLSIVNNTKSSDMQVKSVKINVGDNICLDQKNSFSLMPGQSMPEQVLKLSNCFMLKPKAKFVGVTDEPDSLALMTTTSLVAKDIEVTINYTQNGFNMQKDAYFTLLFLKK
ncbi:MAG: hypothetical protein K0R49_1564 [Burkholderiales bacterium]|jgi:hypothetical protein|nr:hypothetical protein [Burkholderiales bacterium]